MLPGMFLEGNDENIHKIPVSPCAIRTLGIGISCEKTLSVSAKAFIKLGQRDELCFFGMSELLWFETQI